MNEYKAMNEEPVKPPEDGMQPWETRRAENLAWQQSMNAPVDAPPQTWQARSAENTAWQEPMNAPEDTPTQPREVMPLENKIWQEPVVNAPEDFALTGEAKHEENIEMLEHPPVTPAPVVSESLTWLERTEIDDLKSRWSSIQNKFVDEPRTSVQQADALAVEALALVEKAFSNKRSTLEQQWINLGDSSTEELRTALKAYRSFINTLLAL